MPRHGPPPSRLIVGHNRGLPLLSIPAPAAPTASGLLAGLVDPVLSIIGITHSSTSTKALPAATTKAATTSATHPTDPTNSSVAPPESSATSGPSAPTGSEPHSDGDSPQPSADGALSSSSAVHRPSATNSAAPGAISSTFLSDQQSAAGAAGPVQNAAVVSSESIDTTVLTSLSTRSDGSVITYTTTSRSTAFVSSQTGLTSSDPPGGPTSNGQVGDASLLTHKAFPSWAIGIIVTFVVIFAVIFGLFFARRYQRKKRADRRARWAPVMVQHPPSARSSFATHFDHGDTPVIENMPRLPSPATVSPVRLSDASDAQFVIIDRPLSQDIDDANPMPMPLPSPMSVRPFSPTESYKFPRPPSQGAVSSSHSAENSLPSSANALSSPDSQTPLPVVPPSISGGLTIKRPFAPALPDELVVEADEIVHIKDVFDDGWALALKSNGAVGLLPLACFEENDQDVNIPAFMTAHKRLSSMAHFSGQYGVAR